MVWWKGFTAESDIWKEKKNLGNAKKAVEKFEKEYWQDMEDIQKQEQKKETFRKGESPGRFTAKKLFGWTDKKIQQGILSKVKKKLEEIERRKSKRIKNNRNDKEREEEN